MRKLRFRVVEGAPQRQGGQSMTALWLKPGLASGYCSSSSFSILWFPELFNERFSSLHWIPSLRGAWELSMECRRIPTTEGVHTPGLSQAWRASEGCVTQEFVILLKQELNHKCGVAVCGNESLTAAPCDIAVLRHLCRMAAATVALCIMSLKEGWLCSLRGKQQRGSHLIIDNFMLRGWGLSEASEIWSPGRASRMVFPIGANEDLGDLPKATEASM